jgi:hypothetical protein
VQTRPATIAGTLKLGCTPVISKPGQAGERWNVMIRSEQAAQELLSAIDAGEVSRISSLLSPDVCLRLGNDEPIHGLAGVSARIAGLLSAVSSLSHKLRGTWVHADTVMPPCSTN